MNPWLNVACIVIVLCIQDSFGMGTVEETQLTADERKNFFATIQELYKKLKEKLGARNDKVEQWERWTILSTNIKEKAVLNTYVKWAKDGAVILADTDFRKPGEEAQDLIEKAKSKILEIIPENSKPGVAASINKVLDTLKTALKTRSTMEVAESEGTKLNSDDGGNVFVAIRDLYQLLETYIAVPSYSKIVGLTNVIFSEEIRLNRTLELDTYIKWMRKGAIILANANNADQGKRVQDLIEKTKSNILSEIPESNVPGAAASINKVLDHLKTALEKCITMEDAETEGPKLNRKERTLVYGYVSLLYYELKNELKTEIEEFTSWAQNIMKFEKEGDRYKYVKWVESGATMIINANASKKNTKVQDRIEEAKSKIGKIISENSNPDATASINKVLDILKTALEKRITLENAETEENEVQNAQNVDPNEYVEGTRNEPIISKIPPRYYARIEEVIKHIEENISEDAAKAINKVLTDLREALHLIPPEANVENANE